MKHLLSRCLVALMLPLSFAPAYADRAPGPSPRRATDAPNGAKAWVIAASYAIRQKDLAAAAGLCEPHAYTHYRAPSNGLTLQELFAEAVAKDLHLVAGDYAKTWLFLDFPGAIVPARLVDKRDRVVREVYLLLRFPNELDRDKPWQGVGVGASAGEAYQLAQRFERRGEPAERLE